MAEGDCECVIFVEESSTGLRGWFAPSFLSGAGEIVRCLIPHRLPAHFCFIAGNVCNSWGCRGGYCEFESLSLRFAYG